MANKKQKTQAEKTASAAKAKSTNNKKNTQKVSSEVQPAAERKVPVRFISSLILLALAILFSVILFASEGALLKLVESVIHGLIGRVGFVISIPVLLYLFFIHAFSGKRPIRFRTACLIIFVLLCSCISHLNDTQSAWPSGISLIAGLYKSGVSGITGGVVCGLVAMGIHWLCGPIVSYILLIIAAICMLLGGMGITIPGLIRAYRERPRPEWEDEEEAFIEEPSAAVVNHIANKRIEYLEQKRLREAERAVQEEEAKRLAAEEAARHQKPLSKVEDIMSQIGSDVEDPVAASGSRSSEEQDVELVPVVDRPAEQLELPVSAPVQMPPLELDKVALDVPAVEVPKKDTQKRTKLTKKEAEASATQVAEEIAQAEVEKKEKWCDNVTSVADIALLSHEAARNCSIQSEELGDTAAQIVRDLQPRVAIPMHYRGENFGFDNIDTLDGFLCHLADDEVHFANGSSLELDQDTPNGVIVPAFPV